MTRHSKLIGKITFWLLWPSLYFYLRNSSRTRVIILSGDEILLIRNWLGPGQYTLPGGGVRKNEKPVVAAVREISEETGINISSNSLVPVIPKFLATEKGMRYNCYSYFTKLGSETKLKRQKFEIAELKWVNIHEATTKYKLNSTARQLITTWLDHNHLLD
jgi:8-oxo-dGTP diphosphatase